MKVQINKDITGCSAAFRAKLAWPDGLRTPPCQFTHGEGPRSCEAKFVKIFEPWFAELTCNVYLSQKEAVKGTQMILKVEWSRALILKHRTIDYPSYEPPLKKLPEESGVYVFGRRYGSSFEALYVGKANNIKRRVKGQCNNLRLMHHLESATKGKRVVLAGVFVPKPGQQLQKCLTLIERALIRHFLSDGHDLVNKMGVRLRQHEIESQGRHPKKFFPNQIFLQK